MQKQCDCQTKKWLLLLSVYLLEHGGTRFHEKCISPDQLLATHQEGNALYADLPGYILPDIY